MTAMHRCSPSMLNLFDQCEKETTMNKLTIAAALLAASLPAFADGATYEYPLPAVSSLTRAEVKAELNLAAARGAITNGEQSYVAPPVGRPLSRAEVRQALALARTNGDIILAGERMYADDAQGAPAPGATMTRLAKSAAKR